MPSKTKKQQNFFRVVELYKKGKIKNPSGAVIRAANSMSDEDISHFASSVEKNGQIIPLTLAISYLIKKRREKREEQEAAAEKPVKKKKKVQSPVSIDFVDGETGEVEKAAWSKTPVHIQNRHVSYDFDSIDSACAYLASIGTLTEDEVADMLSNRENLINGFVITYPAEKDAQFFIIDPYNKQNRMLRATRIADKITKPEDLEEETRKIKKKNKRKAEQDLEDFSGMVDVSKDALETVAGLLS